MYSDRSDWLKPAGFPHSEIQGSRVVCTSPWLIAAYHVLHRLHAPRHPPCALSSLTIKFAHRKLDQHIDSLTPSSSRMPKSSLDDSKTLRRNLSFLGILPIRLSKSTNDEMIVKTCYNRSQVAGGGEGTRTPDPMVANQVLCQLSYTPHCFQSMKIGGPGWIRTTDLTLIRGAL